MFHYEAFRYCETEKFPQKIVISPSYSYIFSMPQMFWSTKGFLYEKFWYCETKIIRQKVVILIPLSYARRFAILEIFSSTELFYYEVFGYCESKFSPRKTWYLRLMHKIFRCHKHSVAQKGYCTKSFGTVRQKRFDGKSWLSLPPLLYLTFFSTRNFLQHRMKLLWNVLVLWDKK